MLAGSREGCGVECLEPLDAGVPRISDAVVLGVLARMPRGDIGDRNMSASLKPGNDSPFSKFERFDEPRWPSEFLEVSNGAD